MDSDPVAPATMPPIDGFRPLVLAVLGPDARATLDRFGGR